MCLTQNPDAIPAEPFLKYPKVSKNVETSSELWHADIICGL